MGPGEDTLFFKNINGESVKVMIELFEMSRSANQDAFAGARTKFTAHWFFGGMALATSFASIVHVLARF